MRTLRPTSTKRFPTRRSLTAGLPAILVAVAIAGCGSGGSHAGTTAHTTTTHTAAPGAQPYGRALALMIGAERSELQHAPAFLRSMSSYVTKTSRACGGVLKPLLGLSKSQANASAATAAMAAVILDLLERERQFTAWRSERRHNDLALERLPWSGNTRASVRRFVREARALDNGLHPFPACRYLREFAAHPMQMPAGASSVLSVFTRFQSVMADTNKFNSQIESHSQTADPTAYHTFMRLRTQLAAKLLRPTQRDLLGLLSALGVPKQVVKQISSGAPTTL